MKNPGIAVLILALGASGTPLQFPYVSGKQAASFDISLDNGSAIAPDTIQIGSLFTLRVYYTGEELDVCGDRGTLGLQFLIPGGDANKTKNNDTAWSFYRAYPDSLVALDSIPNPVPFLIIPAGVTKAPGYVFARPGDYQCLSQTFDWDSNYQQTVFIHKGSVYGKLKIIGDSESDGGPPTSPYKILDKVTVRYLVSGNRNDLVDTGFTSAISVSSRPSFTAATASLSRAGASQWLFTPPAGAGRTFQAIFFGPDGKAFYSAGPHESPLTIPASRLPRGLFFYLVRSEKGEWTGRLSTP